MALTSYFMASFKFSLRISKVLSNIKKSFYMENIVQLGLNIGIYKKYTYLISYLVEIILEYLLF